MKVLILGGGGFLGTRLGRKLAADGQIGGRAISRIVLADLAPPAAPAGSAPVDTVICDLADPASLAAVFDSETACVFLLAAVVSAHAEADLDAGLRTNLFGVLNVLERARGLGKRPVLMFASSLAVYGGTVPDPITDDGPVA